MWEFFLVRNKSINKNEGFRSSSMWNHFDGFPKVGSLFVIVGYLNQSGTSDKDWVKSLLLFVCAYTILFLLCVLNHFASLLSCVEEHCAKLVWRCHHKGTKERPKRETIYLASFVCLCSFIAKKAKTVGFDVCML
jgi:hypothetical protein